MRFFITVYEMHPAYAVTVKVRENYTEENFFNILNVISKQYWNPWEHPHLTASYCKIVMGIENNIGFPWW